MLSTVWLRMSHCESDKLNIAISLSISNMNSVITPGYLLDLESWSEIEYLKIEVMILNKGKRNWSKSMVHIWSGQLHSLLMGSMLWVVAMMGLTLASEKWKGSCKNSSFSSRLWHHYDITPHVCIEDNACIVLYTEPSKVQEELELYEVIRAIIAIG